MAAIVFPMPIDIIESFLEIFQKFGKAPIANAVMRGRAMRVMSVLGLGGCWPARISIGA
jgi:hypothetical protein